MVKVKRAMELGVGGKVGVKLGGVDEVEGDDGLGQQFVPGDHFEVGTDAAIVYGDNKEVGCNAFVCVWCCFATVVTGADDGCLVRECGTPIN